MVLIKSLVIALIIAGGVFIGFSGFFLEFIDHPRDASLPTITVSNRHNFSSIDTLNKTINDLNVSNNQLLSSIRQVPILGEIASILTQGLSILTFIGTLPGTMTLMLTDITTYFGIPAWVSTVVVAIIITIITFTFLSAFLNREET